MADDIELPFGNAKISGSIEDRLKSDFKGSKEAIKKPITFFIIEPAKKIINTIKAPNKNKQQSSGIGI